MDCRRPAPNSSRRRKQGQVSGAVSYIQLEGFTVRLMAYTPSQNYSAYRNALVQSIRSFRKLTDPAILAIQPARVQLVRIPRSMTISEFNQSYPSKIPLAEVALINGADPSTTLPAGTLVKRVQ
jgi:predicted Zn-dependent protease